MFALLITLACGPNEQETELAARLDQLQEQVTTADQQRQVDALRMQLEMARTDADLNALAFRVDKAETNLGSATAER